MGQVLHQGLLQVQKPVGWQVQGGRDWYFQGVDGYWEVVESDGGWFGEKVLGGRIRGEDMKTL